MLPKTMSSHHGSRETPHEVLPGLPVLSWLLTERPPPTGIHVVGGGGLWPCQRWNHPFELLDCDAVTIRGCQVAASGGALTSAPVPLNTTSHQPGNLGPKATARSPVEGFCAYTWPPDQDFGPIQILHIPQSLRSTLVLRK